MTLQGQNPGQALYPLLPQHLQVIDSYSPRTGCRMVSRVHRFGKPAGQARAFAIGPLFEAWRKIHHERVQ